MDRTAANANRFSDRLMIALTAMLAANLGVTLINSFQPATAQGQVHSYSRASSESARLNTRMSSVERKLDGELKVRVINFPAGSDKSK